MTEQEHTCYYCGTVNKITSVFCGNCGNVLILQDRYRITGVLGQGGFGIVYDALDTRLNRRCAIKRVTSASSEEQKQVHNEVDILSQYASQFAFIPTIYDSWTDQQQTYMVMEFIDGPALDDLPRPWPPPQVEQFLRMMLNNLTQLHSVGIIHRDIKPQNIKHTPQGRSPYTLLDFGIAKRGGVTSVKALSPDYAPIEQMQGSSTDARSDLYSLAATAYFLLTDLSPLGERVKTSGHLAPPSKFVPETPPNLEKTLMWMLEKEPDNRPPVAEAALHQLDTGTTQGQPTKEQPTQKGAPPALPIWEQQTRQVEPPPRQPAPRQPAPPPPGETTPFPGRVPEQAPGRVRTPPPVRQPAAHYPPPEGYRESGAGITRTIFIGLGALIVLLLVVGAAAAWFSQQGVPNVADLEETVTPSPSPSTSPTPEEATTTPEPEPTPEPTAMPEPDLPPPPPLLPQPVIFTSNRDGDFDIYAVDTDGSLRNLTDDNADNYAPAWSRDNRIAFHSNQAGDEHIFVMNSDGSGITRLTSEAQNREPTWSPDGRIAYMSGNDSNWDIFTMNADGSNQQNLTSDNFAGDFAPSWSPNGGQIAYTNNASGDDEIYVMGTDGRNKINLTSYPASDKLPAWSPDSQWIAFVSDRDGNNEIYVMSAEGNNPRNLSRSPGTAETQPAWSSDGEYITFVSDRDGNREVYIMNRDGTDQRRISENGTEDWDPVWAP